MLLPASLALKGSSAISFAAFFSSSLELEDDSEDSDDFDSSLDSVLEESDELLEAAGVEGAGSGGAV